MRESYERDICIYISISILFSFLCFSLLCFSWLLFSCAALFTLHLLASAKKKAAVSVVSLTSNMASCICATCPHPRNTDAGYLSRKPPEDHSYCCSACRESNGNNHGKKCSQYQGAGAGASTAPAIVAGEAGGSGPLTAVGAAAKVAAAKEAALKAAISVAESLKPEWVESDTRK